MKYKKVILYFFIAIVSIISLCSYRENNIKSKELRVGKDEKIYTRKTDTNLLEDANKLMRSLNLSLGKLLSKDKLEGVLYSENYCEFNFERGSIALDIYSGNLRYLDVKDDYFEEETSKKLREKELLNKANGYYNILINNKKNYELTSLKDSKDGNKNFSWNLKLSNQLISKYNTVEISINSNTGNLKSINILDSDITNDLACVNISKENAEKIINKFVLVNKHEYSGKISMEVVRYNDSSYKEIESFDRSRIAWVGEIKDKNNNIGWVHIDITDGIVIGGDWA